MLTLACADAGAGLGHQPRGSPGPGTVLAKVKTRAAALGYRPELDGLRAVAVAAVMLFHANVSWARGGFLGVDIFFVLSGFLITRLLLEERELTDHIALLRFYLRRILRLFPALVVVCLAVAIYATIWLPHAQLVRTWHDVFATATYHMNWVQALHQQPAFGLLDHAWSLSIEEQFYVVWPLILIVAHRAGGVKAVGLVALVGALASAGLRVVFIHNGVPDRRIYFGLDSHADGLLLGCALAALTLLWPGLPEGMGGRATRWLGPAALVAVGLAASRVALTSRALYQWGYLLFVVVTAVLVADLYARGLTSRLLRNQPLVAVGRISYGLYLWHWPVYLVLNGGRIHWGFVPLTLLRLAVSGICAAASFALVEQPFLRLKHRLEPAKRASYT
jgi:peptidoglycan/LPS O-acetylase OafA/YrhL